MATFVLIHGAWHGGWCWQKVASTLRGSGHKVYTPTLTGVGERAHLASPEVDVDTHILDIVNALEFEDLNDVVLVGHSYGGLIAGAVTSRVQNRVAHTVYLDALIPSNNRSSYNLFEDNGLSENVVQWQERINLYGNGWLLPPPDSFFGIIDKSDQDWLIERLKPQPVATFNQPISLDHTVFDSVPHSFIACTPMRPGAIITVFANQARNTPGWQYREIEACHDVMVTEPQSLADLFVELL